MANEDIDAEAPMNRGELEKMVDALVVAAIAKAAPKEEPEEESLRARLRRERDERIQGNRDKRNPVAEDLIEPPGEEDEEMPQGPWRSGGDDCRRSDRCDREGQGGRSTTTTCASSASLPCESNSTSSG